MSRWDEESNQNVYEYLGKGAAPKETHCGVDEWIKHGTLRWFRNVMRMNEN